MRLSLSEVDFVPCKTSFLSFLLIVFLLGLFTVDYTKALTLKPQVFFILNNYSTYINFEDNEDFTTITVEINYITFDSYRLIVQTGNVTFINWFNDDSLKFSTIWSSESTTQIYMNGSSPIQTPYKITYLNNPVGWYWFGENNTLKLDVPNPNTIEIFWIESEISPPPDEPIPPSPPTPIIIPSEEAIIIPQKQIANFLVMLYPYAPYLFFGGSAIVTVLVLNDLNKHKKKHKNIKHTFGSPYSPHRKRVNLKTPKSPIPSLDIKKSKTPRFKKRDPYD